MNGQGVAEEIAAVEARVADEVAAVEARIAAELERLAMPRLVGGRPVAPPAYVRRHAVEHAAAGGVLGGAYLSEQFLPELVG